MTVSIEKEIKNADAEQFELAAEKLAQILIQQVIEKRNRQINKNIKNKDGKSN